MTTDERDRKHADLLLAQKKAEQELALRRNDAHVIGKMLSEVGAVLQRQPELFFSGMKSAHYDVVSPASVKDFNEFDLRNALNYDAIVEIANAIRKAESELNRVRNTLQVF